MENDDQRGLVNENQRYLGERAEIPALMPYQIKGAHWLSKKTHALLADEMGLGKSAQSITASHWAGLETVLVVCPAIARFNWADEFHKFDPGKRSVCVVLQRNQTLRGPVIVCSYDLVECVLDQKDLKFDLIILDEAHFLKNPTAKRTQKVLGKYGLVHRAKCTWALTGTPTPNHIGELWPLLFTFRATTLSYEAFIHRFCVTIETGFGKQIIGTKTEKAQEIQEIMEKIMFRRMAKDVLKQLPQLIVSELFIEPQYPNLEQSPEFFEYTFSDRMKKYIAEKVKEEEKLVEQMEFEILNEPNSSENEIFAKMEALSKSVSTLRRFTGLQKVKGVADLVKKELKEKLYQKIVIFGIHRDVIFQLEQELKEFQPRTIVGQTSPANRQIMIHNFQQYDTFQVMLCNIQAAGTAINLAFCDQLIFIEQDWVPANNAQAAKRLHRVGQTRPVKVRIAVIRDSFDQRLGRVLARKTKEISKIFNQTNDILDLTVLEPKS